MTTLFRWPPILSAESYEVDRVAALHQHARRFEPDGPRTHDEHRIVRAAFGEAFSGCQPRRYSSPAVGFCVQIIGGPPISQREMHTLQPMHTRISSMRPSSTFFGKKGSAIEGRAAPMMSAIALRDDLRHLFGVGEAAYAQHRFLRDLLDEPRPRNLVPLQVEARWSRILRPIRRYRPRRRPTGRRAGRPSRRTSRHPARLRYRPCRTAYPPRIASRSRNHGRRRGAPFSSVSTQKRARFSSEPP